MTLPRHPIKRGRVEVIPLIDTVLILLIFYMSLSSFRGDEKQLAVPLPSEIGNVPPQQVEVHVRGNDLMVNGVVYEAPVLQSLLAALQATDSRIAVTISATPETKYQAVIRAVDVCAQAKVRNVAFRPLNG